MYVVAVKLTTEKTTNNRNIPPPPPPHSRSITHWYMVTKNQGEGDSLCCLYLDIGLFVLNRAYHSVILKSIVGACSIQEFFFTSHLIILCKLVLSSCFKPSALSPQPPPCLLCPNMGQGPFVRTEHCPLGGELPI